MIIHTTFPKCSPLLWFYLLCYISKINLQTVQLYVIMTAHALIAGSLFTKSSEKETG